MTVSEISSKIFDDYARTHPLRNFYQSKEYGNLMKSSDFEVMYIGIYENDILIGASLILHKVLYQGIRYGYAPRGFLIDYYSTDRLTKITKAIKDFFFRKKFAFIKINPEIPSYILDFKTKTKKPIETNIELINTLKELGYQKLKDNLYFESLLPKYNPIVMTSDYDRQEYRLPMQEALEEMELSGLRFVNQDITFLPKFYDYVRQKNTKTLRYYEEFFKAFEETNKVDLLEVKINYDLYVKYLQKKYAYESSNNDKINAAFRNNPNSDELYKEKCISDKLVSELSKDIEISNIKRAEETSEETVGAAFIIKSDNKITIYITGQTKGFKSIDVKTFIYYKAIQKYKDQGYEIVDLYGMTGDFKDSNPYKDLNEFKLKFKPTVYEYLGEFDLIVNKMLHKYLWNLNKIQEEFYHPAFRVINSDNKRTN